ncbi:MULTISPECIES: PQQ-binding-like beta-propeller repeat protein [unclassified Cohnella]|uniref:outer membrane protein assembly factor BamB family protein n=1 Tax=unclassified Cohnella TaxID=2636738 RepID=UPI00130468D6|nr:MULTISPECIES: PQQ-binding-like beta-propeller repeat protein [unclassified Cohnella]
MNLKRMKRMTGAALSLALLLSAWPAVADQAGAAGKTSYTREYGIRAEDRTNVLKPKWQIQVDVAGGGASEIATADGRVFYSYRNKIMSVDAATGKTKWTYDSRRSSPLVANGGFLYFVNSQGYLIKLNGKTGKARWKTKIANASENVSYSLVHEGDTMYVTDPGSLAAFDAATGKRKWNTKSQEINMPQYRVTYDGIVVVSGVESGAITTLPYYGYDAASGKRLWKLYGIHTDVLHEQDGYLYARNEWPVLDNGYAAVIDKVDVKTGKIAETLSYIPEEDTFGNNAASVVIEGNSVYVEQQPTLGESKVSVFSLDSAPDRQTPRVYEGRGKWLAGPYSGRLYFEVNQKLIGLRDGGNGFLAFNGPADSIAQLDLLGRVAVIGLTNGQVYLADASTGKIAGKLLTEARQFGVAQIESGMAIIQAESRIYAVALPSSLAK